MPVLRIIHSGRVEKAVEATLREWLHTFLNDAEGDDPDAAQGHVERPKHWIRTTDPLSIPSRQLPVVAIASAGWAREPIWDNEAAAVWWAVEVAIFAKGDDRDDALDNTRLLAAAVIQTLTSKSSLDGFADDTRVLDLELDLIDGSRERTLAGASAVFEVLVPRSIALHPGPTTPDPEGTAPPRPDTPTAETVTVTVKHIKEIP
jgi:hypothetical protein